MAASSTAVGAGRLRDPGVFWVNMQVEIWSDIVCPWCYLGKRRFERALADFDHRDRVEVVHRSFELDPSAPPGVTTPTVELLASKYRMSPAQAERAQRQMEERAAADGLAFRMDGLRSGNTRDAHRLLQLAKDAGRQDELMERLQRAYFTDQESIFDHESLTRLASDAGLDAAEVSDVLASDRYTDHVETDEKMAQALGATGVPLFVIDRRYGISGAQPAETITAVLDQAWAEARYA
ncbi:MAG TPA: DsbA family oxidoreductase [Streptosporangiaceae bacterium]|nr:DsbA family oxidoreductase [Streptosporangiaceae bacterium]